MLRFTHGIACHGLPVRRQKPLGLLPAEQATQSTKEIFGIWHFHF